MGVSDFKAISGLLLLEDSPQELLLRVLRWLLPVVSHLSSSASVFREPVIKGTGSLPITFQL